jgi:calcium-independent phospholipase A2-gamma
MNALKERNGLREVPEPHQYFDLICGTGFGGIIALMLGRLRLVRTFLVYLKINDLISVFKSIKECEKFFLALLPVIIDQLPSTSSATFWFLRSFQPGKTLEEAIKSILVWSCGLPEDEILEDLAEASHCRTFVLAMYSSNMRHPVRLRSYSSRMDPASSGIKIWEAGRATTAQPSVFPPISIGETGITYIDAGIGYSNPAKEALDEAVRIWQISGISCIVSIGSGMMTPARLESNIADKVSYWSNMPVLLGLMKSIVNAVTDTERTHEELSRESRLLGLKYFRFNVDSGLENIGYRDTGKVSEIGVETELYLRKYEVSGAISYCALHLRQGLVIPGMGTACTSLL